MNGMKRKILPFINLGLAVVMLFFALPKLGAAAEPLGNAFWIAWTALAGLAIAANGNTILMSEEKRERLLAIKRHRALRFERKLAALGSKTTARKKKERVNESA